MQLSENTLAILKNFAVILSANGNEGGIVMKPGNELSIITQTRNVYAEAKIAETIPVTFGIHDIPNFLSNISNLGGPAAELEFDDKKVVIRHGDFSMEYYGTEPSLINSPTKKIPDFDADVTLTISNEVFQKILKIAALNGFEHISILGENGEMCLRTNNPKLPNQVKLKIQDWSGPDFEAIFAVSLLKFLPLDYVVSINLKGLARFVSSDGQITYLVTLVKRSEK